MTKWNACSSGAVTDLPQGREAVPSAPVGLSTRGQESLQAGKKPGLSSTHSRLNCTSSFECLMKDKKTEALIAELLLYFKSINEKTSLARASILL
jgi:hypothetical protein